MEYWFYSPAAEYLGRVDGDGRLPGLKTGDVILRAFPGRTGVRWEVRDLSEPMYGTQVVIIAPVPESLQDGRSELQLQ